MVKIISWNIARREEAWQYLLDSDADVALVQEAAEPPVNVAKRLNVDPAPWRTAGSGLSRPWRTAVVQLSNKIDIQWFEPKSINEADPDELAVSRLSTLAAATIKPLIGEPFIAISLYAAWEQPHRSTGSNWIYADASVHRLISDLSSFIGKQTGHRIIAAGDLNILHGYGEYGNKYWASRYATVFDRMETLGLSFVGPQSPNGRQADPWPEELPNNSNNLPTYHTRYQNPMTATRQLDFVFSSSSLVKHIHIRALNEPSHWGPSDHCQVEIEIP